MSECIFCQIVDGKIPSQKVYEDEFLYAFRDINPVAPEHVLVIPKKHISSLMHLEEEDKVLAGKILLGIKKIAKQLGLDERGFRVVNNIGQEGGQTVFHIHFHLLGGRQLTWPPG
ncbi:histidine triad nucleotide-binding protein [Thermoflavimicrobium dichotomicum]|uniref:Histidine triad (HIT) family protein n=1 Tax=Thermoflavimicrobium dichotomicum TaxID=46223 RepID=A0A1I3NII1_9BACL|nr:histidine triad nucleotide-binding protein [Thermoflavimicrobium dichotomicum]SFJ09113.1 histidine triad (HIT) family protein [Thermoflavimicrobium dichotomicum]